MTSLAKRFPFAYWTCYAVLGKALPNCILDVVCRPWQSASRLHIGRRMSSLAKRFPVAYWTSYVVLGKALPGCILDVVWRPWQNTTQLSCLLDIVWRPWHSASHFAYWTSMASLAKRFPLSLPIIGHRMASSLNSNCSRIFMFSKVLKLSVSDVVN